MSNLTVQSQYAVAPQTEEDLIGVLQNSLYPGANKLSVQLVLGYCQAARLDPMQKPVHIVPMYDKNARQMRDTIMPGIGLYRTQASRTGEHVGTDDPIFGPMVEMTLGGQTFTVPEWCKVTVWRMKGGQRCSFTATEYWIENYATAGKDTEAPNAMWKKRPRGQLSKCAEAQALRKGFPDEVGSAPTAEEMEGKMLGNEIDITPGAPAQRATELPECTPELFTEKAAEWRQIVTSNRKTAEELITFLSTRAVFTEEQKQTIRAWAPQPEAAEPQPE